MPYICQIQRPKPLPVNMPTGWSGSCSKAMVMLLDPAPAVVGFQPSLAGAHRDAAGVGDRWVGAGGSAGAGAQLVHITLVTARMIVQSRWFIACPSLPMVARWNARSHKHYIHNRGTIQAAKSRHCRSGIELPATAIPANSHGCAVVELYSGWFRYILDSGRTGLFLDHLSPCSHLHRRRPPASMKCSSWNAARSSTLWTWHYRMWQAARDVLPWSTAKRGLAR